VNVISGACRASFATRSSFVSTVSPLSIEVIFPFHGSLLPARPSHHRVHWGVFPCFSRYHDELRLPATHPTSLRCPSVSRTAVAQMTGPPKFLGNPREHAMLKDPGAS
jgi:hypothetical protein